jgi:hypothetical protein
VPSTLQLSIFQTHIHTPILPLLAFRELLGRSSARILGLIINMVSKCVMGTFSLEFGLHVSNFFRPPSRIFLIFHAFHQDNVQPSETVMFLTTFTRHIISQPTLSQDIILEEAAGRLSREWTAWVDFVDSYVNRQGGMFASSEMSKWLRVLDELVQARRHERLSFLKDVQIKLVRVLGIFVDPHCMQI